jgi:hypothetical protein
MPLYRPHIPTSVKVKVAERQFDAKFPNGREPYDLLKRDWTLSRRLEWLLFNIARAIGCGVSELRLDHDPPLGARPRRGEGKRTVYTPAANDPKWLSYRPHGVQFEGSHDVKTRIRGDHGQYSDITLIKRQRRRERRELKPGKKASTLVLTKRPKKPWPKRKFETRRKP